MPDDVHRAMEKLLGRAIRPMVRALPCPICKSEQVQVCMDSNNPDKDFAKCRICYCQAPLKAWNGRK